MRPKQARAWHYIKRNEQTRMPRRHIFVDTESRIERGGKTHDQTWRLGCAIFSESRKGTARRETSTDFLDLAELWKSVSNFCGNDGRTIVWAHNLGHDARISEMFTQLPKLGWTLVAHNISGQSAWLEWRRDRSTLLAVDSTSVFPTTIAKIGEFFGIAKVHMDLDCDDNRVWLERCRVDVRILATAVTAYLDWLESDDMGNWQITGNGQSWATFRHKFLTHNMCVHDEKEVLLAERRAMWTGRCEAYWHGELKGERIYEFDFRYDYPRIARDYAIPTKLIGAIPEGYAWRSLLDSEKSALLAECRVTTALPVVPCLHNGRILWPTGTFTTTLWDVEIKAAIDAGADVEVTKGWAYRKVPALRAWAEWILDRLQADDKVTPAWQKTILKHWSRALIGRMAMTYRSWEVDATMPDSRLLSGTFYDRDSGEQFDYMQIGTTFWRDAGRVEWDQSMPMVTGYIQAIARVQLWNILRQLPERSAVYADTDSIFVTGRHFDTLSEIAARNTSGDLRLKRAWDGFAVYGPRQIVTGTQVRISGIPKRARRIGKREFEGEIWDTLQGAFKRGDFGKVITRDRRWKIDGIDHRRRGTGFGWTSPISISESTDSPMERIDIQIRT